MRSVGIKMILLNIWFITIISNSEAIRKTSQMVFIVNENMESIPSGDFEKITQLEIKHSSMESLENLSLYQKLETFTIVNTTIDALNETFYELENLKKLTSLTFKSCSIKTFDLSRLKFLKSLKHLNLAGNPGIKIHGSAVWSKVIYLNLANNTLTELPLGLKHMHYLEDINVDGNSIPNIPSYLYKIFRRVKRYSDKQNNMKTIPDGPNNENEIKVEHRPVLKQHEASKGVITAIGFFSILLGLVFSIII